MNTSSATASSSKQIGQVSSPFVHLSNRSELFAESLSKATDKSSALKAVTDSRALAEFKISELQKEIESYNLKLNNFPLFNLYTFANSRIKDKFFKLLMFLK